MKKLFSLFVCLFVFGVITNALLAQVNPKLSLQGILRDANGLPVPDGTYDMEFNIYDHETTGTSLWNEVQTGIQVTNGIYAVKLGAVTPLTSLDFALPYFVGISINGSELAPRIELTYAPYTIRTLVEGEDPCEGKVGDIKYSCLDPTSFVSAHGDCWIPMDGRDIMGTELATIMGWDNVPDMSGRFLRAHEWNDGNDPDRTTSTPIGTAQADQFKSHSHSIFPQVTFWTGSDGAPGGISGNIPSSGAYGAYSEIPGIAANGGNETRPTNMNFYIYIRVN